MSKKSIVRTSTMQTVSEEIAELKSQQTRLKMRIKILESDSSEVFFKRQLVTLTEKIRALQDQKKLLIVAYENREGTLRETTKQLIKISKHLKLLQNKSKIDKFMDYLEKTGET